MKLSVKERMALMAILPKESNFATLGIVNTLKAHLALSEEEHKQLGIRETPTEDGRVYVEWNQDAAGKADKEIPVGEAAMSLIEEELKKLNEAKKLDEATFILYDKFVDSKR